MEKLAGSHGDVAIFVINKNIATIKLQIIVKEEASRFLKNNRQYIDAVTDKGLGAIWKSISKDIVARMRDEFGSIFDEKTKELESFVDFGQELDFDTNTLTEVNSSQQGSSSVGSNPCSLLSSPNRENNSSEDNASNPQSPCTRINGPN
jgi:hypothetical protein